MIANQGDWLVVSARTDHSAGRRGEIVAVAGTSGAPPYEVHWLDTGQTALVYPGSDAVVMTTDELAELDRRAAEHPALAHPATAAPRH